MTLKLIMSYLVIVLDRNVLNNSSPLKRFGNHPNGKGMTPLHLLASKPSTFKSGSDLRWFENIIYHCNHDNPLLGDELST